MEVTRRKIIRTTTTLGIVLCGSIIPFIDYLVFIQIFYLAIPLVLLLFGSVAYLVGQLFFTKRGTRGDLFLAFLVPIFISSQFVATYLVDKVQRYRAEQIIKQINIADDLPADYETLGIAVKIDMRSNSFTVSYSRGFMTREAYNVTSKTWESLGWND